ncbi:MULTISPECIES: hypothetical protein [unclassified Cryobacterium]|uniref:hypothetical protein n=1 Tax=unclassified Cryobacterium TaxID=2649013 RepID=UPI001124D3E0|nr:MULTISPECIES: hypothetical protein [unclassified Cryobacterium]
MNRLPKDARIINLGQIYLHRHRNDQARAHEAGWKQRQGGAGIRPVPLKLRQNRATNSLDSRYHQARLANWTTERIKTQARGILLDSV